MGKQQNHGQCGNILFKWVSRTSVSELCTFYLYELKHQTYSLLGIINKRTVSLNRKCFFVINVLNKQTKNSWKIDTQHLLHNTYTAHRYSSKEYKKSLQLGNHCACFTLISIDSERGVRRCYNTIRRLYILPCKC